MLPDEPPVSCEFRGSSFDSRPPRHRSAPSLAATDRFTSYSLGSDPSYLLLLFFIPLQVILLQPSDNRPHLPLTAICIAPGLSSLPSWFSFRLIQAQYRRQSNPLGRRRTLTFLRRHSRARSALRSTLVSAAAVPRPTSSRTTRTFVKLVEYCL